MATAAERSMRPECVVVGSVNVDVVLRVPRFADPGETVLAQSIDRGAGGKGANQAVACSRDGGAVSFIGAVGDDAEGRFVRACMDAERIDTSHLRTVASPTGSAFVSVTPDGENSIVAVPGANADMRVLSRRDRDRIAEAAVVVLQLETPVSLAVEAATAARGLVMLNAAPAQPLPRALQQRVDVLVVNETEARTLLDAIKEVPTVVITLGSRGARLQRRAMPDLLVPARPVVAIDTTGAGDVFCGVLAAGLARGRDWADLLDRATVAASLAVRRVGAQVAMPTATEIDAALHS